MMLSMHHVVDLFANVERLIDTLATWTLVMRSLESLDVGNQRKNP